jgi:UrcA family protein
MTNTATKFNDYAHAALLALTVCLMGTAAVTKAATPASAPARSMTVAYGDLNLNSTQGTNALYARIVSAAREVCGADKVDIRNLGAFASERSCESGAVTQAVQALHNPALAALAGAQEPQG